MRGWRVNPTGRVEGVRRGLGMDDRKRRSPPIGNERLSSLWTTPSGHRAAYVSTSAIAAVSSGPFISTWLSQTTTVPVDGIT